MKNIKIYEGFIYQLTKYQLYILSKLNLLKLMINEKYNNISNYKSEFTEFKINNKLNLDPKQYINYNIIINYTPPQVVYEFEEILGIDDMLKSQFEDDFKYCFMELNFTNIYEYHPLVRMEIICDLYDAYYLDMYNTYYKYNDYRKYDRSGKYVYVYKLKLKYLYDKQESLYLDLKKEIYTIKNIFSKIYEYRKIFDKEKFELNFNYHNMLNKVYENEEKFIPIIEYNLIDNMDLYYKTLDEYEKLFMEASMLYNKNMEMFNIKMERFEKINSRVKIMMGLIEPVINKL